MRFSIRLKLFAAVAVSLVVIFSMTMYLIVADTTHRLRDSLNQQSTSFASLATTPIGNTFILYKDSGTVKIDQQVAHFSAMDPDVSNVSIVATDGTLLFTSQKGHDPNLSYQEATTFEPLYGYHQGYVQRIIQPLVETSGVHRYAVVYDISAKRVAQDVAEVVKLLVAIGLGFLLLSIGATSLVLNRLLIGPVRKLSHSATLISTGKYDEPIETTQKDEIGELAQSVKHMAESLKADIAKLQEVDQLKSEFMMITSHNLRTPLSMMRGYLELAHEADTAEELKKLLDPINESVSRMHLLAEDMLTIANLETGAVLPRSKLPIRGFVESIGREIAPLATKQARQWHFENKLPDGLELAVNQTSLRGALVAIIDNALKFTHEGDQVAVEAWATPEQFTFKVSDTGIGIAPEEQAKLFTKFHRGTDTLTYDYEGAGIGLYLAKLIVQQHGGDIKVTSVPGLGTTCTVVLPLAANGPTS